MIQPLSRNEAKQLIGMAALVWDVSTEGLIYDPSTADEIVRQTVMDDFVARGRMNCRTRVSYPYKHGVLSTGLQATCCRHEGGSLRITVAARYYQPLDADGSTMLAA